MESLTDLEREFVLWAAEGYTHEQIAKLMYKSRRTIDGYRDSVLRKTRKRSTLAAIVHLIRQNIIQ